MVVQIFLKFLLFFLHVSLHFYRKFPDQIADWVSNFDFDKFFPFFSFCRILFFFYSFNWSSSSFFQLMQVFFGLPLHCLLISTKLICKLISPQRICLYLCICIHTFRIRFARNLFVHCNGSPSFFKMSLIFSPFFLAFLQRNPRADWVSNCGFHKLFSSFSFCSICFFSVLINQFFDFVSVDASFLWSLSSFTLLAAIL